MQLSPVLEIATVAVITIYLVVVAYRGVLRARRNTADLQNAEEERGYGDTAELVLTNNMQCDNLSYPVEEMNKEAISELVYTVRY